MPTDGFTFNPNSAPRMAGAITTHIHQIEDVAAQTAFLRTQIDSAGWEGTARVAIEHLVMARDELNRTANRLNGVNHDLRERVALSYQLAAQVLPETITAKEALPIEKHIEDSWIDRPTPQALIQNYTHPDGTVDYIGLGSVLANLLPDQSSYVQQVLLQSNSDASEVILAIAEYATDDQLHALAATEEGRKLLAWMFKSAADGGPANNQNLERLLYAYREEYKRLRTEPWLTNPALQDALHDGNARFQTPDDGEADGQPYRFDEFSVVVHFPQGETPQQQAEKYLLEMEKDFNRAVNNSDFDHLATFHRESNSPSKLGDIYDIDLGIVRDPVLHLPVAAYPSGLLGLAQYWHAWGPVMLVERDAQHFVFQTLHNNRSGSHPVHGGREFGYELLPDGGVRFYTRSVARHSAISGLAGADEGETKIWHAAMVGIGQHVINQGGHSDLSSIDGWVRPLTLSPQPLPRIPPDQWAQSEWQRTGKWHGSPHPMPGPNPDPKGPPYGVPFPQP